MDTANIERIATDLQLAIWNQRNALWPNGVPPPIEMLNPEIGAQILGINLEYYEYLPWFTQNGQKYEIAGLIDRDAKRIAVAKKFRPTTVRFTLTHEIGHWLLHPGAVMHRDIPIEGLSAQVQKRPKLEQEADHFAACFLMPRKLATKAFRQRFPTREPFVFNDDTAQLLCPSNPDSLLGDEVDSLDRVAVLASARKFGTSRFVSLAEAFRVSVSSMAIRLRELELIRD